MKRVLACDLGGTNLRLSIIDESGNILKRLKTEAPHKSVNELIEKINQFKSEVCLHENSIKTLAMAIPAALDAENGIVFKAPNLPFLDGLEISRILEDSIGLPCFIENDANAAAIGEHAFGSAKGTKSFITLTIGTGLGGAIFINNELWRGLDGTAGEIGHICVEPMGVPCGCGSRGCLEQYTSASAVVRIARELRHEFPESSLHSKLHLSSKEIFKAALQNDELALKVFEKVGFYLGIGIASLINVLNPEAIVIGGGGSNAWQAFINYVKEQVQKRAYEAPSKRCRILKSTLGDDAGILGAAKLAIDKTKA